LSPPRHGPHRRADEAMNTCAACWKSLDGEECPAPYPSMINRSIARALADGNAIDIGSCGRAIEQDLYELDAGAVLTRLEDLGEILHPAPGGAREPSPLDWKAVAYCDAAREVWATAIWRDPSTGRVLAGVEGRGPGDGATVLWRTRRTA
jgi:hypothetical protein